MKLITHKSKNLLYRIQPFTNCTIDFQTSYAVLKQTTADTYTNIQYKCQYRKNTTYLRDVFGGAIISSTGKITRTFTTPADLDYNRIMFGINGATIDTLVAFNIKLKPSTTYTFTCNFTNITQGSISWKDMMLVEGSTAGEYEPYSYNLLDKSNFANSETTEGVVFTNNGDGSWTVDGSSTVTMYKSLLKLTNISLDTSHKYLLSGCPKEGSSDLFLYVNNGGALFGYDTGSGSIGTPTKTYANITIAVRKNTTVNNAVFIPQLYDLTLMYGEGNEPTTVNQFYTDHPELKVSPLGFIELKNLEISNKNIKRLRYQTGIKKNLFNINNYSTIGSDIGFDISNLEIGKTYTISCNQAPFTWIKISNHENGYNSVQYAGSEIYSYTFVMSRNSNISKDATQYLFLQMKGTTSPGFARNLSELGVNQIQIEEGSTATFYVDHNGCIDLGVIPSGGGRSS